VLLELGEGYQNGASINKAIKIIYTFLPSFWVLANRVYMKIVVKMKARRFFSAFFLSLFSPLGKVAD